MSAENTKILTMITDIENRLDRHLEIYSENGKESKRVADSLVKIERSIEVMLENSESCGAKVFMMHAKFMDDSAVSRADGIRMKNIVLIGAVIASFGIIIGLLKLLFK